MKTIIFGSIISFVLFLGSQVEAQVVDSVAVVREVDSLLRVTQVMIKKRNFENALVILDTAEKKTLPSFGEYSEWYAKICHLKGNISYFSDDLSIAENWWLKAKDIRERVLGKEHPDYAKSLSNLALLNMRLGQYVRSETLFLEVKSIQEKTLGKNNPDYALTLYNLGELYGYMSNYRESEQFLLESISIREKIFGRRNSEYANSVHNLAKLYHTMNDYEKAEPIYLEVLNLIEESFGKNNLDYLQVLGNLAELYRELGAYEKSESFALEVLVNKEKITGKEHTSYARSLHSLATLYMISGKFEKAQSHYIEAIKIVEKLLGKRHHEYISKLMNLAALYLQMGNYDKAESLFLESKTTWENVYGTDHIVFARILTNLASLYYYVGNYMKFEALNLEAIAVWEKVLGKEHPDYAACLGNLAVLYLNEGRHEKAEPLLLEVKAILEKALGKEHPSFADCLRNLAILYENSGNYEKAEPLFLEAKAILEKVLGKEHPSFATCLNAMGGMYGEIGNQEKAAPLFLEAKTILEKALGKGHPDYVLSLRNLAILHEDKGNFKKAESLYIEIAQINQLLAERSTTHLSEQELHNFVKLSGETQAAILSFASKQKSSGISDICYNNAIFYKGFLLNVTNQLKNLSFSDSATTEQFNLLKSYGRRLAKEYEKPIAERDSARVANLEANSENLEKELTRTVARFAEARLQVQWQEVQQTLQTSEAALEFVHYQFSNPKRTDSTKYAALLLLPQDTTPHFIPLFEQKQLSTLLSKTQSSAHYVGSLYAAARSGIVLDEFPAYGTELYNLIWKPLDSLLQGVKTVYYSPSGLLHRVNLAAIPVDSTHVLADKYTLRQMSSTRNLVVKTPEPIPSDYTAALFGGIQYNSDSTALHNAAIASRGGEESLSRSTLEYTADVQRDTAKTWNYLEGTRSEVDSLQRQMKRNGLNVKTFTGLAATEESLKTLGRPLQGDKSPDILHIATHGFFFDDPEKRREQRFGDENVFRWNENPLFRSGLILAGADHAWRTGRPYANLEDGICTAYEISHLNLSNTKLAVLSACETGLGDIEGSEGVYGLQRAFKMAGVDFLIVSLWKVPDAQTVEFMDAFYRNWLGGKTIHRAFSEAQQMMRKNNSVYEWGAWVLIE